MNFLFKLMHFILSAGNKFFYIWYPKNFYLVQNTLYVHGAL